MTSVFVVAAFVFGLAVRSLGLPPLVGFLGAGFLLGASGFKGGPLLEEVAHLGVLLLLFTVGLKLRLRNLVRAEVWAGGIIQIGLIAVVAFTILTLFSGLPMRSAILLGIALAFSSTVVAAKLLEGKREIRAFHGRVAVGLLIVQDLIAVVILSVASSHSVSPWALVLLGLPLLIPMLGRLLELTGHDELLVLFGVVLAISLGGLGFHTVGLSGELGALLLGALIAEHRRANELYRALWGLKEMLLVGFFVQIGMAGVPDLQSLGLALLLLGVLLPVKAVIMYVVLLMFRLRGRSSFLASVALASYSEFALIVAKVMVDTGQLSEHWLVTLALVVAISFVLAAPLNQHTHRVYERYEALFKRFESKRRHPDDEPISLGSAEILIFGMGRIGTGAYDTLRASGYRVLGLDSDPGKISSHLRDHRRVVYADAEDSGLWTRLPLETVRAILLAMPDLEAKLLAAEHLRRNGYRGLITAVNAFPEDHAKIVAAGADWSHGFYESAGPGFAQGTLQMLADNETAVADASNAGPA